MRYILVTFGLVIAALVGWYELSPRYTLNEMRKAAEAGNSAKLSNWVDYQALKIDLKGELRREILLEGNRRGAAGDPLAKLGADLAVALVPIGVDLVATPEAVQAMFDAKSAAHSIGRGPGAKATGGVAVMPVGIPNQDIVIERHGLSTFKVKTRGKPGAAIFRRYGLSWKLAGFDVPYRFGESNP
ncbi:MAG: DUF2939 domain-containing protein [Sphingomicrobium sp.]